MSFLRLLGVFIKVGALNELEYRVNFYIQVLRSLIGLSTGLAGLSIVFQHTDRLGGWRPAELLVVLGVYFLGLGVIGLVIQPSMQRLMEDVRQGTLDFTLTKPEDAQVLVSIRQVQVWKLVDVLLGLTVIGMALVQIGAEVGAWRAFSFAVAVVSGTAIIYSFWLVLASLSFWFVRIENILVIFQSMYQAGRWPVGIYPWWLRSVLTFVVPVAFATTVPAEALSGRLSAQMLLASVALSAAMLWLSRRVWALGIRNYSGASA